MKKIITLLTILLIIMCGCKKEEPVSYDDAFFCATKLISKDNEEIEFVVAINDKEQVIDYGQNYNDGTDSNYYKGMNMQYSFEMFTENVRKRNDIDDFKVFISVSETYENQLRQNIKEIINGINGNADYDIFVESDKYFINKIAEYKKLMANFKDEPEDNQTIDDNEPQDDGYIINNKGEIVVNVDQLNHDVSVNAEGKNVIIEGNNIGKYCVEINDAQSVDIRFSINQNFNFDEMVRPFLSIRNTSYKNITFPEGLQARQEIDRPVSEDFLFYDISDDGMNASVSFNHMGEREIEEIKERDLEFFNYVLENGKYEKEDGGQYGPMYSSFDIDIGDVVLPNSDYTPFVFGGDAIVKISGTITITGGTLAFSVEDDATLDISELYLIKAHPSPDVARITYPKDYKGDIELLKPKAENGEIKYAENNNRIDVTIW